MPKSCYYCGSLATSREHIPPRQFFKGFECDSITVDSCEAHNTQKSESDAAVLAAFALSMQKTATAFTNTVYDLDIQAALNIAQNQIVRYPFRPGE